MIDRLPPFVAGVVATVVAVLAMDALRPPVPLVPVPDSHVSDSLAAVTDSIARDYADSVTVWRAREAEAVAARAEAQERARRVTRRANATADSLAALHDSTEARLMDDYVADRDSIDAATDQVVASYRSELATVAAERDALLAERTAWYAERDVLRGENAALRSAVDALHDQIRGLERESGLVKIGGTLLVGAVVVDRVMS